MATTPVSPDLDSLWRDLGIKSDNGQVTFDESAPLATARAALVKMRS
jgi:hypothetical protein